MTPPTPKSARTRDPPRVFSPGKTLELTGFEENPFTETGAGALMPVYMKSSTVASEAFLQVVKLEGAVGMQKSWIGSGSDAETYNCHKG